MPDNAKSDRPVESSGVKASAGWEKPRQIRQGGKQIGRP